MAAVKIARYAEQLTHNYIQRIQRKLPFMLSNEVELFKRATHAVSWFT